MIRLIVNLSFKYCFCYFFATTLPLQRAVGSEQRDRRYEKTEDSLEMREVSSEIREARNERRA